MENAVLEVAKAINKLASAVRDLGTGNAATNMGAIEFLAAHIAEAIKAAGANIAEAIETRAEE